MLYTIDIDVSKTSNILNYKGNTEMTSYVQRAYEIDDETKALALECYKESVTQIANKHFMWFGDCAFTKMREIFLSKWMIKKYHLHFEGELSDLNRETIDAFNYANFTLGLHDEFINTAKQVVADDKRVSDEQLKDLSDSMIFLAVFERDAA
jgi:hypothetical protein